jgi:hypothetical protein
VNCLQAKEIMMFMILNIQISCIALHILASVIADIYCNSHNQSPFSQDWDGSNNGVSDDLLIISRRALSFNIALAVMEERKCGSRLGSLKEGK